jgi:hypothetical protein
MLIEKIESRFGLKRYFIPSIEPSKKNPLINKINKKIKGVVAVTTEIFPESFIPFLIQR